MLIGVKAGKVIVSGDLIERMVGKAGGNGDNGVDKEAVKEVLKRIYELKPGEYAYIAEKLGLS